MKWAFQAGEDALEIGKYYLLLAVGLRVLWMLTLLGAPPSQSYDPPGSAKLAGILFYVEMPGNLLARLIMFFDQELWWILYPFAILLNFQIVVMFTDWLVSERRSP